MNGLAGRIARRLTGITLRTRTGREGERGQVLVLFALGATALIGAVAVVTDVSWIWVNQQRMQRAADAAALAGSIYLPGDPDGAYAAARAEAAKNGFVDGRDGIVITPTRDGTEPRRLTVTVSGPVRTYFARICGCLDSVQIKADAAAEYFLPVPMGSPQSYYGVGYFVGPVTTTTTSTVSGQTSWGLTGSVVPGGAWTNPGNATRLDSTYVTVATNGDAAQWTSFGILSLTNPPPNDPTLGVAGIEVRLNGISFNGSGTASSCIVNVSLSPDGGSTWTQTLATTGLTTAATASRVVGSATSTASWGSRSWSRADLTDANFRVKLTWVDGTSTCAATQSARLDALEVRISWRYQQATTATTWRQTDVVAPDGTVLAAQNFWAAMQSQGTPAIQGDAYLGMYDTRTSSLNATYDPDDYYSYAVDLPAGTSNGEVWIWDPGFCDSRSKYGLGEYWTIGGTMGYSAPQPMSSFFDLYDTNATPWDTKDDRLVASSGTAFQRQKVADLRTYSITGDTATAPSGAADCASTSAHFGWWKLAGGLSGGANGTTYRVHTYSTDPSARADQGNTTALNAFAIWSRASGGNPRVYGIGAMQTYVRLPQNAASEFYLARIERIHAGRTVQISLWDPGDTGSMSASLQILLPTTSGYTPATFSWTARRGSNASGASACTGTSGTNVSSVTTNTGGSSLFNGCWLTITVAVPTGYTAPRPSSDVTTSEGGWWKIRYTMGAGASPTDVATDVATWEVAVRGSPVHLVP